MLGFSRVLMIALAAVALAGAAGVWVWHTRHAQGPSWRTSTVRRGDLTATITATGTVEPEEVVEVDPSAFLRDVRSISYEYFPICAA